MYQNLRLKSRLIAFACLATAAVGLLAVPAARGEKPDLKAEFFQLCDTHGEIVKEQARATADTGRPFYRDSYVVRALCVAYDMTGESRYLDACVQWSDRMVEFQEDMIPKGAYYMHYGRKPGEEQGDWYVADCASIALGILATAVRCEDAAKKRRYMESVKSFAGLVTDNFVRPSGGVTDGHWPKSDKEWWCSTGIFGSLAFCLYDETGEDAYRKIGYGTIDWLNHQDLLTVARHFPQPSIQPTVIMYCLEAYSPAFPHLQPGTERHRLAMIQWEKALKWMLDNQAGRSSVDYISQWGGKFGGLPFHMYVYARHVPQSTNTATAADRELRYIADLLKKTPPSLNRDKLAAFAMMSYAEQLAPGAMYRAVRK